MTKGGAALDKVLLSVGAFTLLGYVLLAIIRPSMAAKGLDATADMFMQSVPWIIVSMFAAGLLAQLFDPAVIAKWFGRDSGLIGIILGAILGLFGTGSRWAVYPLAAGLLAADASPGAVFAFMTSWQLVSLPRLPAEIPFLGMEFTIYRAIASVIVSVLGGIILNVFTRASH